MPETAVLVLGNFQGVVVLDMGVVTVSLWLYSVKICRYSCWNMERGAHNRCSTSCTQQHVNGVDCYCHVWSYMAM